MYDNHQKIVKGSKKSGSSSIFLHVSEDLQLAKWNQISRCRLLSMLTDIQRGTRVPKQTLVGRLKAKALGTESFDYTKV